MPLFSSISLSNALRLACGLLCTNSIGQELRIQGKSIPVVLLGIPAAEQAALKTLVEEQLAFSPEAVATAPLADDLAYFTRLHLTNHGWKEADVQWKLEQGEILLTCSAGVPAKLGAVSWSGDAPPVAKEELALLLLRPLHEAHGKQDELPWVEGTVQSGVSLVERRLQAEGHLEATAKLTTSEQAGQVDVAVELKMGSRTTFREVTITGMPEELAASAGLSGAALAGTPCNLAALDSVARTLADALQKRGWLAAEVTSAVDAEPLHGQVAAQLTAAPGLRSQIREVVAAATFSNGARRVLEALFRPTEGRVWDSCELELHFRKALDSGLFKKLDYTAEPIPGASPTADGARPCTLRLTGEEAERYQLGVSGGFDTSLGVFLGTELGGVNLWDLGATWRVAAEYGAFGPGGALSLTDPVLLGTPYSGTAELGIHRMVRYDYSSTTLGGKLAVSRRVTLPLSYSFFTALTLGSSTGPELLPQELGPEDYVALHVGGSLQLDFRDSPVLPTRGWLFDAKLEGVNLETASYLRTDLRASYIHTFAKTWKVAGGIHWTALAGPTATELPIDLRVFNGGSTSVRSFAERELGPRSVQGSTPLGGTMALTASAELSREVAPNLDLALFADAGGLEGQGSLGLPQDFRYAVGLGLRYKLPFGPLRVDYGWNPQPHAGEASGALHVALGFPF